jgi:multidrug efflux pump subunit AcrA (membrane-fusion protein)
MKEKSLICVVNTMNETSSPISPLKAAKPLSAGAKVGRYVRAHKVLTGIVVIVAVGGGWYWYNGTHTAAAAPRYIVEKATTGTIVATVSGSGQVQAEATIDIKPQVSENVIAIPVRVGQTVRVGQLLVQLDTKTEARALTQAQLQLQSAELSFAKLTEAPATTTLIQNQNTVAQNETTLVNASATLARDYQAGVSTLSGSFVDFQNVMTGLQNFVNGSDLSKSQNDPDAFVNLMPVYLQTGTKPYRDSVVSHFASALTAYQQNLLDYHATVRSADPQVLDTLFVQTYHTAQTLGDTVKAVKDFLNYVVNNYPANQGLAALPAVTNTLQTNMGSYTNTVSGDLTSLSGTVTAITADKTAITNAQFALNQASSSLAQLLAGADPLDAQSSELSISQQKLALQTAEENLVADSIRAPVDGVVSAMASVVGAAVPSPAVSMVGNGTVAQVTLNEVDAAKVKMGDTATLTFDAIPGLSLAGKVVQIDPVGTVSQGVVSYNVQVALATPNDQIKPGMSVSAVIVTQVAQDVLAVPNASIVKQGTNAFILEPASPLNDSEIASSSSGGIELAAAPARVPVTLGLSNSTMSEIASGVSAGDQIIVQTIGGTISGGTAAGGTNALRALGGGVFGGGGGARVGGGAGAAGARGN